jgi:hypothetical protein
VYFWSAIRLPTTAVAWRADGVVTSLTAIAKATFALAPGDADLAPVQEPIALHDTVGPDGRPRAPSDLAPFKTRVDVILVGSPFPARAGAPCRARLAVDAAALEVDVRAEAGGYPLAVFGPRRPDPSRGVAQWNVAAPELQLEELTEEPQLVLENLSPLAPVLHVALPPLHLTVYAEGGGITGSHAMRADTLWIDTDRQIACVTYRATFAVHDDADLRATILADHPAVQQDPASLVLIERDDPSREAEDEGEGELPIETGVVDLPRLERPRVADALPFRPATSPGPISVPRAEEPPPKVDDDAPATIPPPAALALTPPPFAAPPRMPIPTMPEPSMSSVPLMPMQGPLVAPALAPPGLVAPASAAPAMTPQTPVPARVVPTRVIGPPEPVSPPRVDASTSYTPKGASQRFEGGPAPERLAHDAGAVRAGLASASNAAAHATQGQAPRARTRRRGDVERPRPTSNDICDLLWFDADLAPRVRSMLDWAPAVRDHSGDRGWLTADESLEDTQRAADRRVIMRALARVPPAEVSTLPRLLAESTDDDGFVARPLLVVAGELSLPPDPHEVLKTSIELAKPFAIVEGDKPGTPTSRLKAAIEAAGEPRGPGVDASLTRIRQAFAALARGLPSDYLEKTVDQTLLEARCHRVRELFGGEHVWCQIQSGTGTPTTVYLSAEAVKLLPMSPRFRVRAITEPHPVQNRADGEGPVLRALAVARVIAQRPR